MRTFCGLASLGPPVSAYTTEETRKEAEVFIAERGNAYVAGGFYVIDGDAAGVREAAAALEKAT